MKQPIIFGHRGASTLEPENTIKAFDKAFSSGALGIEFDVRACSSGEIVVIHDSTIDRTSDGNGKVSKITLKELLQYDFGKGEKIPTLEMVLKKYSSKYWLNIEIKEMGIEEEIIRILKEIGTTDRIIISSFQIPILLKIRNDFPIVETAYLYDFPLTEIDDLLSELHVDGLHPGIKYVSKELIEKAHNLNLKIRAWTIDDVIFARNLAKWQIDGIITNVPKAIFDEIKPKSS